MQKFDNVSMLSYLLLRSVSFQLDFLIALSSLQGSLDNISIIIICFPSAPQVSQEALQQETELEQHIDMKVEGDQLLRQQRPDDSNSNNGSFVYNHCVKLYRDHPGNEVQG